MAKVTAKEASRSTLVKERIGLGVGNEELYDENDWTNDVTEYNDEDWMDWTEHLPTTGVMVLTMSGHIWTGTMTQTGMTRYDNWTWSSGSDSVGPSALSQPQQPAASSSTAASN